MTTTTDLVLLGPDLEDARAVALAAFTDVAIDALAPMDDDTMIDARKLPEAMRLALLIAMIDEPGFPQSPARPFRLDCERQATLQHAAARQIEISTARGGSCKGDDALNDARQAFYDDRAARAGRVLAFLERAA